jgi:hypothetical protein
MHRLRISMDKVARLPAGDRAALFGETGAGRDVANTCFTRGVMLGARGDPWPTDVKIIRPYAADDYSALFEDPDTSAIVLSARRTFWEKATALHAEAHRPAGSPTPQYFSRHYYDLAMLLDTEEGHSVLDWSALCNILQTGTAKGDLIPAMLGYLPRPASASLISRGCLGVVCRSCPTSRSSGGYAPTFTLVTAQACSCADDRVFSGRCGSLVMGRAAALRATPLNPAFVSATPAAASAPPRNAPPTTPTSGQIIPMTAPAAATKGIAIQCRAIPGL